MDLTPYQVGQLAAGGDGATPRLSLVIPVYNELENVAILAQRVARALGGEFEKEFSWELVFVDDGSTDGTAAVIREVSQDDARVRGIFFQANRGQSAATCAGILLARGEMIATMDGDLQNDSEDLPAMVRRLRDHDAVVGRRRKRQDNFVRRASSIVANRIRNWISGDSIQDTGCALKVFRADAIRSVPFFRGAHRFLPTLLRYQGFDVVEQDVGHHPRVAGQSKYGIWNRALPAFLDLLAVRWFKSRVVRIPLDARTLTHVEPEREASPASTATRPETTRAGGST